MQYRFLRHLALTVSLVGLTNFSAAVPAREAQSLKIGVLADMSGVYSDISGKGVEVGAQLAIEDFLKQSPEWSVELLVADHQNKADIASARARQWIDVDGIDMVMNGANSATGLAIAKVAAEKRRVNFDVGAATTRLTNEECTAYTVQYVYDTYMLSIETARTLVASGGENWFFLTADYAFGHALEADTGKAVIDSGGTVKGSVRHPINTADFSSFLLQAQTSGASVIGLANAGGDAINAIKSAQEFGLTPKQTLVGLLMFDNDVHSLTLPVAQGMYLTTAWYWDLNDRTREFGQRFFERMGRMPNMAQAGAYSAVSTYLGAVRQAQTKDADQVMAELKHTRIDDVFTDSGFIREDGRMVHEAYLMQVKTPDESRQPWDYYKVIKRLDGDKVALPLSQSRCPLVRE
ncbi:MAG: ABC transporter substrate-binding protein [Burkholderiaceae bacterium]